MHPLSVARNAVPDRCNTSLLLYGPECIYDGYSQPLKVHLINNSPFYFINIPASCYCNP